MGKRVRLVGRWALLIVVAVIFSGCTFAYRKHHPDDTKKINKLSAQVGRLSQELDELSEAREEELGELKKAKEELEVSLKEEIGKKEVKVEQLEKGLVITFVAEVLFDSGKAKLREESYHALDKVSDILKSVVADRDINIEGHTDNEPIKYSGWKSNWELSSARALNVLHYFVDEQKLAAERLSSSGYGEYRPVADNETPEGKQKNRRVEIVILPEVISKIKTQEILE